MNIDWVALLAAMFSAIAAFSAWYTAYKNNKLTQASLLLNLYKLDEENKSNLANYKNQFKKDDSDLNYLKTQSQKVAVLYEMYKRVKNIQTQPHTAQIISDFLQKLSVEYSATEDLQHLKQEFNLIWQEMKKRPLPQTRQEFEDRAELFTLLELIEEFL